MGGGGPPEAVRTCLGRQPASLPYPVEVPRNPGQPARTAQVVLRWAAATLAPPQGCPLDPVKAWAVWVSEVDPPAGAEPLDWLLLTSVPAHSLADAQERVAWYRVRWPIEVWHHVLKSGCAFEQRHLASAANLTCALALYDVIAWRILYGTLLARIAPEVPCTVLLEVQEWQALYCAMHKTPVPPRTPPTLGQSIRWLAELGGFVGRTGDGQPGALVLWRGLSRLADMTYLFQVFAPSSWEAKSGLRISPEGSWRGAAGLRFRRNLPKPSDHNRRGRDHALPSAIRSRKSDVLRYSMPLCKRRPSVARGGKWRTFSETTYRAVLTTVATQIG